MNIRPEEVETKSKVGKLDGNPVIEVGLKGGLHLVFVSRNGKIETLGAGPHRAVARFIAKKKTENKIEFTDLAKADHIEPAFFEHLLDKYEAMTDAFRTTQGL
jgi:hypothetical protein